MRTILFRGKSEDGQWHEGDLIHGVGHKEGKLFILPIAKNLAAFPGCHPLDGFEVIPKTVGILLSITDKNGKRIFEGDIDKTGDVIDSNSLAMYVLIAISTDHDGIVSEYIGKLNEELEVIGNIHDHE